MPTKMDIKFWASFSVICILLHCCQVSEGRPGRCKGLLKGPNCPTSNISFTKRLLDEIMKRTDGGTAADSDMQWEPQMRTEDKLNVEETKSVMAPADGWSLPGRAEETQQAQELTARHQAEEAELRRKELEILFVRALLDDLENDTLNEI